MRQDARLAHPACDAISMAAMASPRRRALHRPVRPLASNTVAARARVAPDIGLFADMHHHTAETRDIMMIGQFPAREAR